MASNPVRFRDFEIIQGNAYFEGESDIMRVPPPRLLELWPDRAYGHCLHLQFVSPHDPEWFRIFNLHGLSLSEEEIIVVTCNRFRKCRMGYSAQWVKLGVVWANPLTPATISEIYYHGGISPRGMNQQKTKPTNKKGR